MKDVVIEGTGEELRIVRHDGTDLSRMNQQGRIAYWQEQGSDEIIHAALLMIRHHCEQFGISQSLDKSVYRYSKATRKK
jgi:hypothetical protein